jgi:hypothetical protein
VHDIALEVAEIDATKRALATFGKPFGLELYRDGKKRIEKPSDIPRPATAASTTDWPSIFALNGGPPPTNKEQNQHHLE